MSPLFIKICGITTLDDARAAVKGGADALGFNFYPASKRYIAPGRAAEIIKEMPAEVSRVGVFVDPSKEYVTAAIQETGINVLQFSGNEAPLDVSGFGLPVIKAIHIAGMRSIEEMKLYAVDSYLLDAFSSSEFGGTGQRFDWAIAERAKQFGRIIVAGGLTPENVMDAVRKVRPYGVDVSSGVEIRPGVKDHQKMIDFIRQAREAHSLG
ncbi:MAG TPA: phosphoribosylanthranilate isomerase [Bacteroidota bacterium]|nr:phosphoribosylanthranilate isomerase [Bacteroidota bacterium]